jgi:hypothetical protein
MLIIFTLQLIQTIRIIWFCLRSATYAETLLYVTTITVEGGPTKNNDGAVSPTVQQATNMLPNAQATSMSSLPKSCPSPSSPYCETGSAPTCYGCHIFVEK